MKAIVFTILLAMAWGNSYAGNEAGNGGDSCENRIRTIGNDVESWILSGGSEGLELEALSVEQYNASMLEAIKSAVITCTEDKILIAGAEKTCRNYTDENGVSKMECNYRRFNDSSEVEQYRLVHHEFAGIAKIETNNGPVSDYRISNQLTSFLEDYLVKKLAIKKKENHYGPNDTIFLRKNMSVVYRGNKYFYYNAKITSVFEKSVEVCLDNTCSIEPKDDVYVTDSSISISLEDGRTFRVGDVILDRSNKCTIRAISSSPVRIRRTGSMDRLVIVHNGVYAEKRYLSDFEKQIE